jgi:hypothetical protein
MLISVDLHYWFSAIGQNMACPWIPLDHEEIFTLQVLPDECNENN